MRVAIYARTSTHLQSTGLESQLHALKSYCDSNNLINYQIYTDAGVSGAKSSRPGLDHMISDAKAGHISQVVTYSLSRLSRSTTHLLQTMELLKKLGIGFVSLSESIDLNSPMGVMILTVLAAVSTLEREITIERVRTGLVNARAKGKKLGAPKKNINSELLIKLNCENLPYLEIGRLLGCSAATVCRELKRISESSPHAL